MRYLIVLALLLCSAGKLPPTKEERKPLVLVSIAPFKYFVERIAGSRLRVQAIVPSGMSAHSYEPSPQEVAGLQHAVVWFQNGDSFEKKISHVLLQHQPKLILFDLKSTVPLLSYEEEKGSHKGKCCMEKNDPHIWLSPTLAKQEAKEMAQILTSLFPEWEREFRDNLSLLLKDLADLDKEVKAILAPVKSRTLLVSHPAFGYFCKDFGFTQISVEHEGKDPLPQRLKHLLDRSSKEEIQTVLFLPQYNNKGAKLIADSLHLPSAMVDPYAEDYLVNCRHIAHTIAEARPNE